MTVDVPGQHVLERTSVTLDSQVCLCSCNARFDHPATPLLVGDKEPLVTMFRTMPAEGPADHLVPMCR